MLGENQSPEQSSSQKSLLFYNHTECECQSKMDDLMPRDSLPTAAVFAERPSPVHRTDEYAHNTYFLRPHKPFLFNNDADEQGRVNFVRLFLLQQNCRLLGLTFSIKSPET